MIVSGILRLISKIIVPCVILLVSAFALMWNPSVQSAQEGGKESYWLLLHRSANREMLYFGRPGNESSSILVRTFRVKTGIPGKRPTPLPQLLGRDHWNVTAKYEVRDNPETAPYFLALDVPLSDGQPFGPAPYLECDGQCNWEVPGAFGLHGVAGNPDKLSQADPGSSGCIRHVDEDITYLYNILKGGEPYYIRAF